MTMLTYTQTISSEMIAWMNQRGQSEANRVLMETMEWMCNNLMRKYFPSLGGIAKLSDFNWTERYNNYGELVIKCEIGKMKLLWILWWTEKEKYGEL